MLTNGASSRQAALLLPRIINSLTHHSSSSTRFLWLILSLSCKQARQCQTLPRHRNANLRHICAVDVVFQVLQHPAFPVTLHSPRSQGTFLLLAFHPLLRHYSKLKFKSYIASKRVRCGSGVGGFVGVFSTEHFVTPHNTI